MERKLLEDLFVTVDMAKLAQEKGFDDGCFRYFGSAGLSHNNTNIRNSDIAGIGEYISRDKVICSAPTHQQLYDWFERTHGLYIETYMQKELLSNKKIAHSFIIMSHDEGEISGFKYEYIAVKLYETRVEALNFAYEIAFDLI